MVLGCSSFSNILIILTILLLTLCQFCPAQESWALKDQLCQNKFGHDEEQFTLGRVSCHAKLWPTPPSSQYCHERLLFFYSSFLLRDYPCVDHMIDITSSPFYFPYHSDVPPYLCLSHSDLISLLSLS